MYKCNHNFNLIPIDELKQIELNMYPKKCSNSGFLKNNEQLMDVILKDKKTLEKQNITYKQIVDRLTTLTNKYYRLIKLKESHEETKYKLIRGKTIGEWKKIYCIEYGEGLQLVENKFLISAITYMGAQECPFQSQNDKEYHGFDYGDTDFTIVNLNNNKKIWFNTLLIHMIDKHSFFEGNVAHRLDPINIINTIELYPNINYEPIYKFEYYWRCDGNIILNDKKKYKEIYHKQGSINGIKYYIVQVNNEDKLFVELENIENMFVSKCNVIIDGIKITNIYGPIAKFTKKKCQYIEP